MDDDSTNSNYFALESIEIYDAGEIFAYGKCERDQRQIPVINCINFMTFGIDNLQSCPLDRKHNYLVHMDAYATGTLFDLNGRLLEKIILPNMLGHKNDSYIEGDILVTSDGNALSGNEYKKIFEYNFQNGNLHVIDCKIGEKVGTRRVIGGVCKYNDFKHMIVAYDYRGNYNDAGDSLYVFELDRTTEDVNLMFKLKWEGWFIQGITQINNILYVATNMIPEVIDDENWWYTGINLWKIDVKTGIVEDKLEIKGNFEPEGLDSYYYDGEPYLIMGIGSHRTTPYIECLCKLKAF